MSIKLKRPSSKKKKFPKCGARTELLCSLGLEGSGVSPLDPSSLLQISTWALEERDLMNLSDLPREFLRRLWLLSPDARSPSLSPPSDITNEAGGGEAGGGEAGGCEAGGGEAGGGEALAVNPLDLVTAVFMSSNTFLQQDIVSRMFRCHFAVPLVLPSVDPQESGRFLLWPWRSVFSKWRCYDAEQNAHVLHEGALASTPVCLVSCVRVGHCAVSKSQTLNRLMQTAAFLHQGSAGGRQARRLANGLVEVAWFLPRGDADADAFPAPLALANLRGDAGEHEKHLTLLCRASSVLVVFCGNLQEKEKQLVSFCKNTANKVIVVASAAECAEMESDAALRIKKSNVEDVAARLQDELTCFVSDGSTRVTLSGAARSASETDLSVDEGPVCGTALALAEQVLEDLDKDSARYREKQLPLQGPLWRRLAEIEKDANGESEKEKKEILEQLSSYKMTPAMKVFTDALFTTDKMERTYFLNWMKFKLSQIQDENQYEAEDAGNDLQSVDVRPAQATESENGICDGREDAEAFCPDSGEVETADEIDASFSAERRNRQTPGTSAHQTEGEIRPKPDVFRLGLQHFLREIGLIYQLTHINPTNVSHTVLRLPGLAVELLLYGVPLEVMDGDAAHVPAQWLASVFAELRRRLPQEQLRTRVLATLGSSSARHAEVLSAVFNVRFHEERKRCTRGIYLLALRVPRDLQHELKCDFLLLLQVQGVCSGSEDTLVRDNEMATVATALADVLIENVSSHSSSKFDHIFTVLVNALLRSRERASTPICQIVSHDENINTILQARQLDRLLHIFQTKRLIQNISKPVTIIRNDRSLSEPLNPRYGNTVTALKNNLINAIKESYSHLEAKSLAEFMVRLCVVWDAVRGDAFSVSLRNTDSALSFSVLCTELAQWERTVQEHVDAWFSEATKRISATESSASQPAARADLLNELMDEAHAKVMSEVDAVVLELEACWGRDRYLNMCSETLKPALSSNMDVLRERVTRETKQRLMKASESHLSSIKMRTFETLLKKELEIKLCELIDHSRATSILQKDKELEDEFESVWCKTVTTVDLRPHETEDIAPRVKALLRQNLNSRGLRKYTKNTDKIGQTSPEAFRICDEHTAHQTRLKYMFKEDRKTLKSQAQQAASCVIDQYNHLVAAKASLQSGFSDTYIRELLQIVEKTLIEKNVEVRTAFEVDLKVYLCSVACKDFQKLYDRHAKDDNLLERIGATKTTSSANFVYQFRKRDQCQRAAGAFTSQVLKPFVLDWIDSTLGTTIVEEIQHKHPEYRSALAFYRSCLEELLNDDYQRVVDFLLSYDTFREKKIRGRVLAHLSQSDFVDKQRHQRLGRIVGKIASAVSQTGESHVGTRQDTKLLLEDACLALERDSDADVRRPALDGPLYDIGVDRDRFVSCLMEEVAAMRLQLSQEFSRPAEGAGLLPGLLAPPREHFAERLRGCEARCPSCRAPCEVNGRGHDVHRVSLHRPRGLLPPEVRDAAFNVPINSAACVTDSLYWRFVFAKFNEQHQTEVPEDWRKITREEALESLKEVFTASYAS